MQRGQGQMLMQRRYPKHYCRGIRNPPPLKIDGLREEEYRSLYCSGLREAKRCRRRFAGFHNLSIFREGQNIFSTSQVATAV